MTEIPAQLQAVDLETTQFNPTHVQTTLPDRSRPAILTFNQQFDSWWQMRGVSNAAHIQANWYQNAWIIPAGQTAPVSITYGIQRWFIIALVLSLVTIITLIAWMIKKWHRSKKLS